MDESLKEAVEKVDAETDYYAEHFMGDCAHPHHFMNEFHGSSHWKSR